MARRQNTPQTDEGSLAPSLGLAGGQGRPVNIAAVFTSGPTARAALAIAGPPRLSFDKDGRVITAPAIGQRARRRRATRPASLSGRASGPARGVH